jgi:hypothetical protein
MSLAQGQHASFMIQGDRFGPRHAALPPAILADAVAAVRAKAIAVVDVRVLPGHAPAMAAATGGSG